MFSEYEMSAHLAKKGFMSNNLVWHQHGDVQPSVADELDENDNKAWMDDMVADIGRGYDLESVDPLLEVHNFYMILAATEENINNDTDVTELQVVTHLMTFKSKYNFSNQCYNDIIKLIIDLILAKHNMPKDLYQSKKIMSNREMNYEKIDACDPRSVRLGLSTDGFQSYSSDSTPYSCMPVFMMPYNLSPNKCLKEGFIFLALVIPDPNEPKKHMNIFLHPLMEELKELCQGVDTYDSHMKCQSMIIWHMANLPVGVSMVGSIIQYVWMTDGFRL
jgi:hypothetical protein